MGLALELGLGLGLGLGLAADDDLTKPLSLAELLARVKALLRRADSMEAAQATAPRAASATAPTLCNGTLQIGTPKRQVRHAGSVFNFTAREIEQRRPDEFDGFLRGLVQIEPDTQPYILNAQGTVLACTTSMKPKTALRVALPPMLKSVSLPPIPSVVGDDPSAWVGTRADSSTPAWPSLPPNR